MLMDATLCGLIVDNAINNAFKHGHPDNPDVTFTTSTTRLGPGTCYRLHGLQHTQRLLLYSLPQPVHPALFPALLLVGERGMRRARLPDRPQSAAPVIVPLASDVAGVVCEPQKMHRKGRVRAQAMAGACWATQHARASPPPLIMAHLLCQAAPFRPQAAPFGSTIPPLGSKKVQKPTRLPSSRQTAEERDTSSACNN